MNFDVESQTLLTFWGFSVSTGWIVSFYLHEFLTPVAIVAFWTILMSMPVIASIKWMAKQSNDSLPMPWIMTTALGLGLSFAVVEGYISIPEIESYAIFWFFLPAVAFSSTTYYVEGFLTHLYTSAALANFVMAAILLFNPRAVSQYYILAAVFQGLPLLYHGYYEF